MRLLFMTLTALGLALGEKVELTQSEIDGIISKFTAKEADFSRARENYTYRQAVKLQEIDPPGGAFEVTSDITFSLDGKRVERVLRAPVPNLKHILLTPEDEQDIRGVQPFVLTTKDLPNYHVRYLGTQKVDEIPCFIFAVKPKKLDPGQRYFSGQVWVDDRDLQIVKSYGRATGLVKKGVDSQYPKFETYREQIDGKFWFPTYTSANDVLQFETQQVRIKMTIRYTDYKQFRADVKITFEDDVAKPESPKPAPKKP